MNQDIKVDDVHFVGTLLFESYLFHKGERVLDHRIATYEKDTQVTIHTASGAFDYSFYLFVYQYLIPKICGNNPFRLTRFAHEVLMKEQNIFDWMKHELGVKSIKEHYGNK